MSAQGAGKKGKKKSKISFMCSHDSHNSCCMLVCVCPCHGKEPKIRMKNHVNKMTEGKRFRARRGEGEDSFTHWVKEVKPEL